MADPSTGAVAYAMSVRRTQPQHCAPFYTGELESDHTRHNTSEKMGIKVFLHCQHPEID